jgi:glycosyltransferase involved in cell wall biosynthesis
VKISIIIPVYNEFRTFHQVMDRVRRAPVPANCSKEIIVVDDGSTDGTAQMIAEYMRTGEVAGCLSASNAGKGAAIRKGIELASGDVVLIQDGDLEYDPDDYARLIQPILSGQADIVYGSRFLGKRHFSRQSGMAFRNRIANWILTMTANLLYSARISDEATAYKAFRTPLLRDLPLQCVRFEFCPEVTAKLRRLGYRIHEVPISYNARGVADGKKIRARDGVEALWTLIRYRCTPRGSLIRERNDVGAQPVTNARG